MNNQAAQTMPELPAHRGYLYLHNTGSVSQVYGYTAAQMHQYARDYAALAAPQQERPHPDALQDGTLSKSTAKRVEALAASGGEDKGDPVCHEDDGCPTEGAVLKRFWRSINTHDTKQLMAFYGVDDVASLIGQQVEHVQSLQAKLYAPRTPAGNARLPKSPREG